MIHVKKYKARILPAHFEAVNIGETVPLIRNHDIYGEKLGDVTILNKWFAVIESDKVEPGGKLSAGSFVISKRGHHVREVSVTESPKFPECEIIEEVKQND